MGKIYFAHSFQWAFLKTTLETELGGKHEKKTLKIAISEVWEVLCNVHDIKQKSFLTLFLKNFDIKLCVVVNFDWSAALLDASNDIKNSSNKKFQLRNILVNKIICKDCKIVITKVSLETRKIVKKTTLEFDFLPALSKNLVQKEAQPK